LGPHRDQDIDPEPDELRDEVGEPLVLALLPAILNGNGLALDVAALAQALAEGVHIWPGRIADIANPRHRDARLRLGGTRRHEQAEGQRDDAPDSAAPHSHFLASVLCRPSSPVKPNAI
jgi:hypothetical protein